MTTHDTPEPPRTTMRPFCIHGIAIVLFLLSIVNTHIKLTPILYSYVLIAIGLSLISVSWIVAKRERDTIRRYIHWLKQLESE